MPASNARCRAKCESSNPCCAPEAVRRWRLASIPRRSPPRFVEHSLFLLVDLRSLGARLEIRQHFCEAYDDENYWSHPAESKNSRVKIVQQKQHSQDDE